MHVILWLIFYLFINYKNSILLVLESAGRDCKIAVHCRWSWKSDCSCQIAHQRIYTVPAIKPSQGFFLRNYFGTFWELNVDVLCASLMGFPTYNYASKNVPFFIFYIVNHLTHPVTAHLVICILDCEGWVNWACCRNCWFGWRSFSPSWCKQRETFFWSFVLKFLDHFFML